jgi:hypothetical protein
MGSMWALCDFVKKEDYMRISITFDKFVIWIWSGELSWRGVWCNIKEEGIIWKCTCMLFQWKVVEKLSCVLREFILLEYEEGNII